MAHITIPAIDPIVDYTVGGVSTTVFAVPFPFFENADLVVTVGATVKTLNVDYTVVGAGLDSGRSVTLLTGVTDTTVTIERDIEIKRVTDFPATGPLDINGINTEFDRTIAIVQDQALAVTQAIATVEGAVALFGDITDTTVTTTQFTSRATLILATVSVLTTWVRTAGYATAGDGGGALYKRISTPSPVKAWHVQSADGAYWELAAYPVNVRMLGASPSAAAAANVTAFQTTSDYLDTFNGGTAWVPRGTYNVDGAILPAARVDFVGEGNSTNIVTNSATAHVFDLRNGSCRVAHLKITYGGTKTAGAGIKATAGGSGFIVERVETFGMWNGVEVDSSTDWTVTDSKFLATWNDGVLIYGTADIMQVHNVLVTAPGALGAGGRAGLESTGPGDITVTGNCQFVGTSYGISLVAAGATDTGQSRFSQVLCDHNAIGLIIKPVGASASCSRTTFSQCDFTSATEEGVRLETSGGSRVDDITFDQCNMNFNGVDGLRIVDTGVTNIRVTNCLIAGNAANGVDVAGDVNKVKIIGNVIGAGGSITGNGVNGVLLGAGTGDYITVIHNNLLGNATAITNGASGTNNTLTPNDT